MDAGEQDPLVGAMLDGRYHVQKLIGKGGMGRVYAAEEVHLRRRCALKVLPREHTTNPAIVERFFREAQVIAQLSHENIVEIYSFGKEPEGEVFFAMELLTGEDLEARLRDRMRAPPAWQEICRWGVQIARALAAVHAAGYVHRDLKPGNIYLARRRDGSEVIKLLDFGIVLPPDSELTGTGAFLGTLPYMSPEQVQARPLDGRSDIYSFGILLYRALAGRPPFRGDAVQMIQQHINEPPPPLAEAPGRGIPAGLVDIIDQCLRKPREDRFQTMQAVEQALARVLAHVETDEVDETTNILASRPHQPPPQETPQTDLPSQIATRSPLPALATSPAASPTLAPNPAPEAETRAAERPVEPDSAPPPTDTSPPPRSEVERPAVTQMSPPAVAPQPRSLGWWIAIAVGVAIAVAVALWWPAPADPVARVLSEEQHEDPSVTPMPLPIQTEYADAPIARPAETRRDTNTAPAKPEKPAKPGASVKVSRPTPSQIVVMKAAKCRPKPETFAEKITIEYTVIDGKVLSTKAVQVPPGAPEGLIACLKDAVQSTHFDHELGVGRTFEL